MADVLKTALTEDPEERFVTAGQMVTDLLDLADGEPETGEKVSSRRPRPPARSHDLPAQTAAFVGRETELAELARLLALDLQVALLDLVDQLATQDDAPTRYLN